MDKPDRVISMREFEGKGPTPNDSTNDQVEKFREAVRYLKMSLDLQIAYNGYFAIILHAKFEALMEAGFDEGHALQLCR